MVIKIDCYVGFLKEQNRIIHVKALYPVSEIFSVKVSSEEWKQDSLHVCRLELNAFHGIKTMQEWWDAYSNHITSGLFTDLELLILQPAWIKRNFLQSI
jgi:hypothetical protein